MLAGIFLLYKLRLHMCEEKKIDLFAESDATLCNRMRDLTSTFFLAIFFEKLI